MSRCIARLKREAQREQGEADMPEVRTELPPRELQQPGRDTEEKYYSHSVATCKSRHLDMLLS